MNETIKKSFHSAWIIIKLVVPFSIASDLLQYYGIIDSISFIFEPFTNSLNLPAGVALSFASVIFFNLYAGIAVASTLNLSGYEWTIVGTFMAICHSLPLETAVLKKVGMGITIHWIARVTLGYLGALLAMYITPIELHTIQSTPEVSKQLDISFLQLFVDSSLSASILALKVVLLVVSLIVLFDYIKKLDFFKDLLEKHAYLSSLLVGGLLGVTYGAGILLQEIKQVKHKAKILLLTFLMLAHGLVEETLIFGFVGANILIIFGIRILFAITVTLGVWMVLKRKSY